MLNKIDVKPFDQLSDENKTLLTEFQQQENVKFYHTSNVSQEGIMQMRNDACDQLLLQIGVHIFVDSSRNYNNYSPVHVTFVRISFSGTGKFQLFCYFLG